MQEKGGISVSTQNIFPVIKRWLYSDKDIFLREVVSNSCDAVTKHKRLVSLGECESGGEYRITVTLGDNPNYDVTVEEGGTFNITKAGSVTVTLHGKTSREQYDGSEHRVIGYVVDSISSPLYTENDFSLADGVKAIAKRTKLGTTYMEHHRVHRNFFHLVDRHLL